MGEKTETVSSKIPKTLRDEMNRIIQSDGLISESEFIRIAIREKVKNDAHIQRA